MYNACIIKTSQTVSPSVKVRHGKDHCITFSVFGRSSRKNSMASRLVIIKYFKFKTHTQRKVMTIQMDKGGGK